MSFCPRCGTATTPGLASCASCGAALAPQRVPPIAATGARGPVGRTQEPALVILLTLVTLGIYGLFYWWRVSKEVDAYAQRPGHAHGRVRMGLLVSLGAIVVFVVGAFLLVGAVASAATSGALGAEPDGGAGVAAGVGMLLFVGGAVLALAGGILMLTGQWRVWSAIRDDEARRADAKPLSPGVMLAFVLVPYVNIITMWIALHRTQRGLNGMWAAAQSA